MGRYIHHLQLKLSLMATDCYQRGWIDDSTIPALARRLGEGLNYESLKKAWAEGGSLSVLYEQAIARLSQIDFADPSWFDPSVTRSHRRNEINRRDRFTDFEAYFKKRPIISGVQLSIDAPDLRDRGVMTFEIEQSSQLLGKDGFYSLFFRLVMKPGYYDNGRYGFRRVRLRFRSTVGNLQFHRLLGEAAPILLRGASLSVWGGKFNPEWFLEIDPILDGEFLSTTDELCSIKNATTGERFFAEVSVCKKDFSVVTRDGTTLHGRRKDRILGVLEFMKLFGDESDEHDHGWVKLGSQAIHFVSGGTDGQ